MSQIFVEGLGTVNIQGEVPSEEEKKLITDQLKLRDQNNIQPSNVEEKKTESFIQNTVDAFKTRDTALAAGGLGGFASGARLGAMAGSPFGPYGAVLGGLTGGVLGAAGTGQVYDILNSYIKGDQLTLDDTSKQAFKDIKREAMWSAVGMSIPGMKPAITRLLSKRQKGELVSKDVKELYDAGKRIGVDILPVDISGRFGTMYGKVVGVFPFVGTPIKKAAATRGTQLNVIKDQILDDLAPNTHLSDLGVDMFNAAKNSSKEFKNISSDLYQVFYKEASKINKPFIPSNVIKDEANKIIKNYLQARPREVLTKTIYRDGKKVSVKMKKPIEPAVSPKYANYIRSLSRLDDYITPSQVKQIKQDLANFSSLAATKDGAGVVKLSSLAKASDASLRNFEKYNLSAFGSDPKVSKESLAKLIGDLKSADAFYANGIQLFNRSTAQKFTKVNKNIFKAGFDKPGSIEADELFKYVIKTGSPQSLKDLRVLIGDDNFNRVSRKIIDNAFSKASVRDDKLRGLIFNPYVLEEELGLVGKNTSEVLDNLTKGSKINRKKLEDLITVSKAHANIEIPDVSSFMQRRVTLGGARSILGGFVMGAGILSSPIATATLMLVSRGGSKFLSNPKNVELAIEALDITSPRSVRYIAGEKLLRGAVKDSTGEEKNVYENLEKMYRDNKKYIIENSRWKHNLKKILKKSSSYKVKYN